MNISECNEPFVTGLRAIIASKGLKKAYVAEQSGFSRQEFADMINGRRLIKACDIPKLAEALGVKESEIYEAGKKSDLDEK